MSDIFDSAMSAVDAVVSFFDRGSSEKPCLNCETEPAGCDISSHFCSEKCYIEFNGEEEN